MWSQLYLFSPSFLTLPCFKKEQHFLLQNCNESRQAWHLFERVNFVDDSISFENNIYMEKQKDQDKPILPVRGWIWINIQNVFKTRSII